MAKKIRKAQRKQKVRQFGEKRAIGRNGTWGPSRFQLDVCR
jgi:hypothetical protein